MTERSRFPTRHSNNEQVINTEINDEPVVVYYEAQTNTAIAYSRTIEDETLEFSLEIEEDGEGITKRWLVDASGSQWLPLNGQAWSGDFQGSRLQPVHAVNVFWFAWSDFYPETEIYGQ